MAVKVLDSKNITADLFATIAQNLDRKMLLLLPAGSFLNIAEELSKKLRESKLDLSNLTATVIDERWSADPSHDHSNYNNLCKIPDIAKLLDQNLSSFQVLQEGLSLEETTKRFDKFITEQIHNDVLIVGVVGVGTDGHLAGILPHKQEYTRKFRQNYVTGYDMEAMGKTDNPHRFRVTLNFNGLSKVNDLSVYAVGVQKLKILKRLVGMSSPTHRDIAETPVYFLHTLKTDVKLYTDHDLFD